MKHYQKLRIRNFIKLIIFPMIFIFSFFLVGCSNEKSGLDKDTEYEKTEEILGTVIIGKVYGEKSKEALEEAFKRAKNIENIMSAKLSDSELTKVNENAYEKEVKISEDLYFIIEKALYYSNLTEGAFDPTIGKLIDLWGIGTENERIPEKEEIDLLKGKKNYKNVVINKENSTIRFLDKDIKLDLGAIAKGYAADEMKKIICEKYKIKKGILNLGGNVMAIGSKNENEKWKVGITNPLNIEDVLAVVKVEEKTVVTSGNYERYFIKDNVRYHHILNPDTGYPAEEGVISTTIITKNSIDADALSTATYILGKDKGLSLIESLKEVEAIFVDNEGNITKTSGINDDIFEIINN